MPVYELYIILSIFTFLFSFEWCRLCRVPFQELYFPTQSFSIRTSFPQGYFIFYSEFIFANIVILSRNDICRRVFFTE